MKKAETFSTFWTFLIRFPMIVIMILFFLFVYTQLFKFSSEAYKVNDVILVQRILYSPTALAYQDPITNRVYPGIIDISKFNDEQMERGIITDLGDETEDEYGFKQSSIKTAARIEITPLMRAFDENDPNKKNQIFINRDWYERLGSLTDFENIKDRVFRRYVLLREGEFTQPGVVMIHVVSPDE